jgi:dimethylhistidine N-methyltransferase
MSHRLRSLSVPLSPSGSACAFLRDVLHGLSQPNKRLPCKYFYDDIGGQLFERICDLEEYYPTRCELAILERHAADMAERMGAGIALIEYGSGSSRKTRLLLDQLRQPAAYCPVDINGEQLRQTCRSLTRLYPTLPVHPIETDFTRPFTLPALPRPPARRVVYFSGSTIGNFERPAARELLRNIAALCGPGGGLLIAVDLKKDPRILHAAYNDRLGVTAAFNVNLLARINRELGADFDPEGYHHYAFYNPEPGRIEMHLLSRTSQTVHVGDAGFTFANGESICTEYSYKYSREDFQRLADDAGLQVRAVWLDERELFSVQYLSVEED